MRELAQYADNGAWDSLWVYDHFHTVPMPTDEATHEAWSLMSAYAASTSRIKLGQMCTAMSYRNPVYLAKVAATADIISGGRVADGYRRRLVRARVEGLRVRIPVGGVRLAPARRGCPDHARRLARRTGHVRRASTMRSMVRSSRRSRCRTAVFRCGSQAAARRSRCKIAARVRAVHELQLRARRVRPQVAGARRSLPPRRHRL